jgi:hypothetical protein
LSCEAFFYRDFPSSPKGAGKHWRLTIPQKAITRENGVIGILASLSVVMGAAVAYFAERFPARIEALQTGAGVLLIGGFALAGSGLPIIP